MSSGASQQLPRSVRNCCNNTNIDTIQCESYAPKLRQRPPLTGIMGPQPKSVHTKPNRERSASRSRCIPLTGSTIPPTMRSLNTPAHNRVKRENSVNSIVRKELYSSADNPLVEVTVKTCGQQQQQQQNGSQTRKQSVKSGPVGNRGEPWSKILQQNNVLSSIVSEGSSFSNFDPLRTVHFLAQELQSKLQDNLSDDDSIRQIISDMQQALNRVPPEVASTLGLSISPQYMLQTKPPVPPASPLFNSFNYDYPTRDDMRQERLLGVIKGSTTSTNTVERGSQTSKCRNLVLEPEKFQQHLEFSTAKIESACRQMEIVCSKLKTDKEELERDLLNEREMVLNLRSQLDQTATNQSTTKQHFERLEIERSSLQKELQQLKAQLNGTMNQNQMLQQLQSQKIAADEQVTSYKQQLTISRMETEKYVAILAARDKQVTEIRSEMNQLQELVIEQLREIQTGPFSSSVTSCTTNATSKQSFSWVPSSQIHNKNNCLAKDGFIDLDRNIYKEIAEAMAATNTVSTSVAGTTECGNGGETTTVTSGTGSGASSTTTIHGAISSAINSTALNDDKPMALTSKMITIDLTDTKQDDGNSKSNMDVNATLKAANLMLSNCTGIPISNKQTNNQQKQRNIADQPHSASIRDMFAEIKKHALMINSHQQKSA